MTLVESIARIYASDSTNEIIIYTHEKGFEALNELQINYSNINIIAKKNDTSILAFLKSITKNKLDKIYITTCENYYNEWLSVDFKCPEYIVIHNVYDWFRSSFLDHLRGFFLDSKRFKNIFYAFKINFIFPTYKKKIIKKCRKSDGRFVVLSDNIADELSNYIDRKEIQIVPFNIYDKTLLDTSFQNKKLRICIPGRLSQARRDYFGFINLLHSEPKLKDLIEIDFLGGYYSFEQGPEVFSKLEQLKKEGYKVYIQNETFIPSKKYDEELSKADIILGNMHVKINNDNIYGKSKETGVVFLMIRNAKPGILPATYNNISELTDSTITYRSENDLKQILLDLASNREKVNFLKIAALKNSLKFTPEIIYSQLLSQ